MMTDSITVTATGRPVRRSLRLQGKPPSVGSDSNKGTSTDAPFKTISYAQAEALGLAPKYAAVTRAASRHIVAGFRRAAATDPFAARIARAHLVRRIQAVYRGYAVRKLAPHQRGSAVRRKEMSPRFTAWQGRRRTSAKTSNARAQDAETAPKSANYMMTLIRSHGLNLGDMRTAANKVEERVGVVEEDVRQLTAFVRGEFEGGEVTSLRNDLTQLTEDRAKMEAELEDRIGMLEEELRMRLEREARPSWAGLIIVLVLVAGMALTVSAVARSEPPELFHSWNASSWYAWAPVTHLAAVLLGADFAP